MKWSEGVVLVRRFKKTAKREDDDHLNSTALTQKMRIERTRIYKTRLVRGWTVAITDVRREDVARTDGQTDWRGRGVGEDPYCGL